MQVYVFKSDSDLYGFTAESSGGNLPADKGPWTLFQERAMFKDSPLPRIGVNEADVVAAIDSQGFYLTTGAEAIRRWVEGE
jgi:hypothetical protein